MLSYTHLHHMFLYLNKHFNQQISQIARSEIQATLESDKRLQKDHLYDIGTFMLSIAITPDYQWKNIRKPVLLEVSSFASYYFVNRLLLLLCPLG